MEPGGSLWEESEQVELEHRQCWELAEEGSTVGRLRGVPEVEGNRVSD